jgi:hypothetical protein
MPMRTSVLPALLLCAAGLEASTPLKLSGSIAGVVRDAAGIPQMGATVILYNRSERPVQRALTNEKGEFAFASLVPDVYAIRVTLASFLPALKRNILVQPGMQSLLHVNLASVFSSIELVGAGPGQGALMSEEFKWVLRGAGATRPVLRALPEIAKPMERRRAAAFKDTRGMVRVSGGDEGQVSALGAEPDLGTSFALATSVFGANQLQFSGNVAYSANTGSPSAAFRTSFRRELPGGPSPQLGVTMRQLYLPVRASAGQAWLNGRQAGAPALRTLSVTTFDRTRLGDALSLEYGASLDSVAFLDRLNYFSPFARLSYDAGRGGLFQFSYISGTPPGELLSSGPEMQAEFEHDLAALALFPRVSLRDGRARVQRAASLEAGYRFRAGSRTFGAAAYRETVSNAALTLAAPEGTPAGAELLPDLFSKSWVLNAGAYQRIGYLASVTQSLGEFWDLTLAFGGGSALTAGAPALERGSPEELRTMLRSSRRHSLTARVAGVSPWSGTRFVASYQWASLRSLTPPHVYLTQGLREGLGLNVLLRQPIPAFGPLPGRLEASAELRNLLAQGYVPLSFAGRRSYLVPSPRSVRGGLSFIF